jgi:hypothetical protein
MTGWKKYASSFLRLTPTDVPEKRATNPVPVQPNLGWVVSLVSTRPTHRTPAATVPIPPSAGPDPADPPAPASGVAPPVPPLPPAPLPAAVVTVLVVTVLVVTVLVVTVLALPVVEPVEPVAPAPLAGGAPLSCPHAASKNVPTHTAW